MKLIEGLGLKKEAFEFRPGDTVRVHTRVVEGESERIQVFDGVVINRHGSGISETFTVRKVSYGVGVERVFPVHSPRVEKVEVLKKGRVRRSRLFYLRNLSGKAARLEEQSESEEGMPQAASAPAAAPKAEEKTPSAVTPAEHAGQVHNPGPAPETKHS